MAMANGEFHLSSWRVRFNRFAEVARGILAELDAIDFFEIRFLLW